MASVLNARAAMTSAPRSSSVAVLTRIVRRLHGTPIAALSAALLSGSVACSSDELDAPRATERIGEAVPRAVHRMVRDGDALTVLRESGLERVDVRTGTTSRFDASDWRTCPTDGLSWGGQVDDIVIRGTKVFLAQAACGVWSFDFESHERRILVDASASGIVERQKLSPEVKVGPLWNGADGPLWEDISGMQLVSEGDHLLGCFLARRDSDLASTHQQLEIWTIGLDGRPGTRFAALDDPRVTAARPPCTSLLADARSVVFSTETQVFLVDRATGAVTELATDTRIRRGRIALDDANVWFRYSFDAIVRIPRAGGGEIVVRPSTGIMTPSAFLALDHEHVYFFEGTSLARMKISGESFEVLAHEDDVTAVVPLPITLDESHVYFELTRRVAPYRITDPATDEAKESHVLHELHRLAK